VREASKDELRTPYGGELTGSVLATFRQVNLLSQEIPLLKLRPISNVRLIEHLNLNLFKLQSTTEDGIALAEFFMFF
jgi:hypothetical protein